MASVQDGKSEVSTGKDPAAARAAVAAARKMIDGGDADGAVSALRNFTTRDDAPPAELADAAKIMAEAGVPFEAVTRYLEAGRGFLAGGDTARARANFAAAYEIDGKNMDALFELGRTDVVEGKKHDGLDKFVEILRKSNLKHLPALYEAGCLYEQDGQHNQAILAFKRVVDRDKSHISALEHLAGLHKVRNQLPDAVGYYTRAAEAAHAQLHNADAKRLAEAALELDGGNAIARKLVAEAAKPVAQSKEAQQQQPAATPAAAAPPPVPAASNEAEPVVPPPPPSTLNIGLPPDVALLEQQSQAMAQLAQVQNAVAQTYKQRLAIEEEIRKAHAALEALERQQRSVDEDLSGRREELAKVVAEREAEEAALAALGDAIAKSKSDLEALSTIPALIAQATAQCTSTSELAAKTAGDLQAINSQADALRGKASSVETTVGDLNAKLTASRQAAEALERQLAEATGAAKGIREAADAASAQTAQTRTALDALAAQRQAVEGAVGNLTGVSKTIEQRRNEAADALSRLEQLQAQRKSQFEDIVFKLPPLGPDGAPAVAPAAARPSATAVAPAVAPQSAPSTPKEAAPQPAAHKPAAPAQPASPPQASAPTQAAAARAATEAPTTPQIDALIAAGKFGDAVQRAQNEANAQPKPADFLVEVADKIRRAGKLEDAAKLYAAARDRDQANGRARYELGSACVDLGRLDEALAMLQTIEAEPEYAVLGQVAIGRALRRKGDLEAAESRFSKALEIEGRPEGDYHQALYQLAELHESKGDPESLGLALWAFEELQTGDPNYGDVAQRVDKLKTKLADAGTRSERKRNGAVKQ
jgi:tetratricopeptide (TPR) repeat protein